NIEKEFTDLVTEFDEYMKKLKFSFMIQSNNDNELLVTKSEIKQIKANLLNIYGIPNDEPSREGFLKGIDIVTQFRNVNSTIGISIEANEPLLNGELFKKVDIS